VGGVDCNQGFQLKLGSAYAQIQTVEPIPGIPQSCQVTFAVPGGTAGPKAPVSIQVVEQNGRLLSSNTASIAVEE